MGEGTQAEATWEPSVWVVAVYFSVRCAAYHGNRAADGTVRPLRYRASGRDAGKEGQMQAHFISL